MAAGGPIRRGRLVCVAAVSDRRTIFGRANAAVVDRRYKDWEQDNGTRRSSSLVSWLEALWEAKQSGCEIISSLGQKLLSARSQIRSRNVFVNSNSYKSGGPKEISPARIYKEESLT
jgi:hypothetical protein